MRDSKTTTNITEIIIFCSFLMAIGIVCCARYVRAGNAVGIMTVDKDLSPAYLKKLFARGEPTVYRGEEQLKYIGLPVGGIGTGLVYLGGDGRLWNWDIFNIRMMDPGGPGDKFYLKPMLPEKRFEQGFALKISTGGESEIRTLDKNGFSAVAFLGQYPVGTVTYSDPDCPVEARLEAFSPFIPLDEDDSGLPAVIMQYTVRNVSDEEVGLELAGWLENAVCKFQGKAGQGKLVNHLSRQGDSTQLECRVVKKDLDIEPPENTVLNEGSRKKVDIEKLPDYGSMALTLLEGKSGWVITSIEKNEDIKAAVFSTNQKSKASGEAPLGESLIGAVGRKILLAGGAEETVTFVVSWYFPNLHTGHNGLRGLRNMEHLRAYYSKRFKSAGQVAHYIQQNKHQLIDTTKLWRDTWYDSTLPYWFLDRTFINTSTLATTVFLRFHDLTGDKINEGRLYGWEGVYLGIGTCTHVLHYEQALGRLFPNLARHQREQVDYGLSFKPSGIIGYRGEFSNVGRHYGSEHAVDGHCGTILRTYREHTTSADSGFLQRNWPKIKKSIEVVIRQDEEKTGRADGILEGPQYNTLDRVWYGKIPWISTMYCAALRAGEAMAQEVGDDDFAGRCRRVADAGYQNIPAELFNGEYFYQIVDDNKLYAPNVNVGCHVDQILGQSWAWQAGLGPVVPEKYSRSALESIFKYNFHEDIGAYRDSCPIKVSRFYALPGEAGLVICSFPRGGTDLAPGEIRNKWEKLTVGYFSECMTGFSYQAAGNMIWEGLAPQGFTIVKAIHDRYNGAKRNPFNEVEYGNHYSRAMSSYGCFLAACGFRYHGPKGYLSFAPRWSPEDFRAAFTTAQGWGTFSQNRNSVKQSEKIEVKWGKLRLKELEFELPEGRKANRVKVAVNGKAVESSHSFDNGCVKISLASEVIIGAGEAMEIEII